jgi:TIR domain
VSKHRGVFICYRRTDAAGHAGRLRDELVRSRRGLHVFMDVDDIRPGSDFSVSIDKALDETVVLLVIVGPTWATARDATEQLRLHDPGDFVRREITAALDRDVLTIPVLVGGAAMPAPTDLPDDLRALAFREAFELRDGRWGRDAADLVAYLENLVATGRSRRYDPQPKLAPPVRIGGAVAAVAVIAVGTALVVRGLTESNSDQTPPGSTHTTHTPRSPAEEQPPIRTPRKPPPQAPLPQAPPPQAPTRAPITVSST